MPDKPKYFSDMASALFRIQGTVPYPDGLQRGGGHIRNDTAFFLTGKVDQWLRQVDQQAANSRRIHKGMARIDITGNIKPATSKIPPVANVRYTRSILLEHAQATGNSSSLAAGIKTLEFMKRFRTPRGAQVWECPLHAPDLMASAKMVNAYVIAYELTNQREYLELAVQWALTGVPYIYQWNEWPIQRYASIATLCATHYQAPVWIGRPVQWVRSGLCRCVAGSLSTRPDTRLGASLAGDSNQRYPTAISVRADHRLAGRFPQSSVSKAPASRHQSLLIDDIASASRRNTRPSQERDRFDTSNCLFRSPARFLTDAEVEITSPKGVTYQILIDGKEVRTISAKGLDRIPLD